MAFHLLFSFYIRWYVDLTNALDLMFVFETVRFRIKNPRDLFPFETWNTCLLSKEDPITTRHDLYIQSYLPLFRQYIEISDIFLVKRGYNSNKVLYGVVFSCQQIGVNTFYRCIEFQVNSFDSY
jgi:hypothetical protein